MSDRLPSRSGDAVLAITTKLDRDKREPDKVLCHLASLRREVFDWQERLAEVGACDCTWGLNDDGIDEITRPSGECPVHAWKTEA